MEFLNEDMTFTVLDEDGNEVECEALFTFENPATGKNYIVYTDNTTDEEGATHVLASIFDPEDPESNLLPVETEEEWALIEKTLNDLMDMYKDEDN